MARFEATCYAFPRAMADQTPRHETERSWIAVSTEQDALPWLRCDDPAQLARLWQAADQVRAEHVGGAVHLRGLVEFSNYCRRDCAYCGIRAPNHAIRRYRMQPEEIVACAQQASAFGYGTVVLQSGEDPGFGAASVAELVRRIKQETGLAVTLSLGERTLEELALWREAGADRYLLRFETSDPELFRAIHPAFATGSLERIELLSALRGLGYEIGSGVMVGIPGQSYASLARDISLFGALDLDMIGIGPYLPHPATPLGGDRWEGPTAGGEQVPATEEMAYKAVALARLVCPDANIPSTTALATLNRASGRELGLARGGNVVMPNLTPIRHRRDYEIYPSKACIDETGEDCRQCLVGRIRSMGRQVGSGPGGRRQRTDFIQVSEQPQRSAERCSEARGGRALPVLNRS